MDKGLGGKFLLCEHCGMWTRGWVVSAFHVNIVVCVQRGAVVEFLLCDLLYTLLSLELTRLWYSMVSV